MKTMRWSATRIIASGFAFIILAGGLLLTLPIASRNGMGIQFKTHYLPRPPLPVLQDLLFMTHGHNFPGLGRLSFYFSFK
jgi:hypothetical protein